MDIDKQIIYLLFLSCLITSSLHYYCFDFPNPLNIYSPSNLAKFNVYVLALSLQRSDILVFL